MERDFLGKTAFISGSGRNLGKEMGLQLARRGANVVLNASTNREELEATVAEVRAQGAEAIGVLGDVSSPDDVRRMANEALARFETVDILINNAGLRPTHKFLELKYEEWRQVLGVKLEGSFLLSQAFLPGMLGRGWGRIVSIAGVDAYWGKAYKAHLNAANMGLVGLTHSLAVEFALQGITANVVIPGGFNTTRKNVQQWYPGFEERTKKIMQKIAMGRFGEPRELAEVVLFLVSEKASYVTGQEIHVNGGGFPITADPYLE